MRANFASNAVLWIGLTYCACAAQAQNVSGDFVRPLPPVSRPSPQPGRLVSYHDPSEAAQMANSFGSSFPSGNQNLQPIATPNNAPAGNRTSFEQSLHSWDKYEALSDCDECNSRCQTMWYGSAGAVVMGRNRAYGFWTTFDGNNNDSPLMNTQHAGANWGAGGEVTIGRHFSPCGASLAFTYWGIAGLNGFASVRDFNNNLNTSLLYQDSNGEVEIGNQPMSNFFDNSREHRIARDETVNNLEVNLLQAPLFSEGGNMQVVGLIGFRYFRFEDHLSFGATVAGHEFGEISGADEAYLDFRTVNNMYGLQIGANFNFAATKKLSFYATPKVAIMGNQMILRTQLYAANGDVGFDLPAYKNDFSMLAELNFGMTYSFTQSFSGYLGYRIVGVSDLALADNGFLPYYANDVRQNGDLILHGVMCGGAWNF